MKSLLRILILFLVLSYCFKFISYKIIDSQLETYYNEFNNLIANNCNHIENLNGSKKIYIGFKDLKEDTAGECLIGREAWTILIDKKVFDSFDELDKENLLYHELTHCILLLDHTKDVNNYMNPFLINLPDKQTLINQVIENINAACS